MGNKHNPLKTVKLSNEQNHNMIDGVLNNAPPSVTQPPEKPLDKVREQPPKCQSRERMAEAGICNMGVCPQRLCASCGSV